MDFQLDKNLVAKIKSRCMFLGEGRHRRTYLSPNGRWVYKIPLSDAGVHDNWHEAGEFVRDSDLAYCRNLKDTGILLMEYAKQIPLGSLPYWAKWYDCGQVGTNRHGRAVVYDYGL